jgi:polysaccharide pyruvyl transferase WcaK-like protein
MKSLWNAAKAAVDPDRLLQATMAGLIETTRWKYATLDESERTVWKPGEALKLFLAGYTGTRNTGADVRVEEMIRQLRHVVGDEQLELTLITSDWNLSRSYFSGVRQVTLPNIFPPFLFNEVPKHHGVVACEGSMFKSKFADALSTMMAGALGMANAEGKVSVGYGAEAGAMSDGLSRFVENACSKSLVICRNEPSRDVLGALGVRTTSGTDTAWTFEPAPESVGRGILERAGWDGVKPVLVLCPINPFWWPVKPSLVKAAAKSFAGEFGEEHYRSIYFHTWDAERQAKLDTYLDGWAEATKRFAAKHDVFPICVGMEQLDRESCEALADRLGPETPVLVSDTFDMYELVSVLHRCRYMVSSRYHAIVTSMNGRVPSCGVTMDERIRNLMNDRNHPDLFCEVEVPDLAERLLTMLERLHDDGDEIADDIAGALPGQLKKMGEMGIAFADELQRVYPDLRLPVRSRTWDAHLPPLQPLVSAVCEKYA